MSTCLCKLDVARHEPREQLFLPTNQGPARVAGMLCYLTRKTICPFCTRAPPRLRLMDLGPLFLPNCLVRSFLSTFWNGRKERKENCIFLLEKLEHCVYSKILWTRWDGSGARQDAVSEHYIRNSIVNFSNSIIVIVFKTSWRHFWSSFILLNWHDWLDKYGNEFIY